MSSAISINSIRKRVGRFVDYTDVEFGLLTGVRFIARRKKANSKINAYETIWLFRCSCKNKEIERSITSVLAYGDKSSCGCTSTARRRKTHLLEDNRGIKNRAYQQHKTAAKSRGFISYLTYEQYEMIALRACAYCGNRSKRKSVKELSIREEIEFNSIDRRNNEPYYKLENCVPACFVCQMMKGSLSFDEFYGKIEQIRRYGVNEREHVSPADL